MVYKIILFAESGLFSAYINVKGEFFPCSFMEGTDKWKDGINVLNENFNFQRDLWFGDRVVEWRKKLLELKRKCPVYNI